MNDQEQPQASPPPPKPQPEIVLPAMPRRQPRSAGCGGRWAGVGCLAGLALVVVALLLGSFTLDTGFKMLVARARVQIWRNLPQNLEQAERMRTYNNLDRFADRVEGLEDPDALIGEFLAKAAAALEDRILTEAEDINLFLESVIAGAAGQPPARPRAESEAGTSASSGR